ncbi:helix-turn-helix domain-containing protein [Coprococcus comes]|nr:helix-turn-helix domain-containing protein [Coprococcus comes]
MDLIKIGKYIAEKRKALGLTQKQLAEKLNMSDKSVSKWERGICLPDVSIYMELCSILRISINEFLAGEDIGAENVIKKSDSNLIQITKESKKKQKNLKTILAVVTVFAVIVSAILGTLFFHKLIQPKNYITAVDQTSTEMKTAELLSGTDGAYLFHYFTKDEFKTLTIYVSEYQSGTLISKSKVADLDYDGIDSPSRGVIAVVPDFESFKVKLIVADDYAKYSTDFPILENIENREYYGRSASQIKGEIPIQIHSASTIEGKTAIPSDSEQGLMALIYGKDGLSGIPITEMEKGIVGVENDYVYYLSFQFGGNQSF